MSHKLSTLVILAALSASQIEIAYGQEEKRQPKIIRTSPIVIPCAECVKNYENIAPLLFRSPPCSCRQPGTQSDPNALIQPSPVEPYTHDHDYSPDDDHSGMKMVDPSLLAGPISAFLSSILGGLRQDAVSVQFDGDTEDTAPQFMAADPPTVPNVTGNRFPSCPDADRKPQNVKAIGEEELYKEQEPVVEDQCPRPPTDRRPYTNQDSARDFACTPRSNHPASHIENSNSLSSQPVYDRRPYDLMTYSDVGCHCDTQDANTLAPSSGCYSCSCGCS